MFAIWEDDVSKRLVKTNPRAATIWKIMNLVRVLFLLIIIAYSVVNIITATIPKIETTIAQLQTGFGWFVIIYGLSELVLSWSLNDIVGRFSHTFYRVHKTEEILRDDEKLVEKNKTDVVTEFFVFCCVVILLYFILPKISVP